MEIQTRASTDPNSGPAAILLTPYKDVALTSVAFLATSREPWLQLNVDVIQFAGKWVELIYDAALLDIAARPILRCFTEDGHEDAVLPAAILGRAIWRGRISPKTVRICLSPTDVVGPFRFVLCSLRRISLAERLMRARRPRQTWLALGYAALGWNRLSVRMFRRTLMSTPLRQYPKWTGTRRRPPDWNNFDRLPLEAAAGPHIRIFALFSDRHKLHKLRSALAAQPWTRWSLLSWGVADPSAEGPANPVTPEARLADLVSGLAETDLCLLVRPEDDWANESVATFGVAAMKSQAQIFYSDEELTLTPPRPLLKPDWSPILSRKLDLVGRAWAARVGWLRARYGDSTLAHLAEGPLELAEGVEAKHVARILLTTSPYARQKIAPDAPHVARPNASASIIIPTRDRVELLRACVNSVIATDFDFEIVIVDNDSREAATLQYLEEVQTQPRIRIIKRPGPFNYSALCNLAAREARSEFLVFLNNDTEALSRDWLSRLIYWAASPSIGAVGAKLLYPNGRVQHAGVIVGVDGHAGHFERSSPAQSPGYFERATFAHEVSAVTGACLVVSKANFQAIEGFDEVNLPVEFNDIDLCLRLRERGLVNIVDNATVLIHHEAASRRAHLDQEERYKAQVDYFKARWLNVIRNDPYFAPGLSLNWHSAALG